MDENRQESMTTLAVAIGRVEEVTRSISAQFSEYKIDHKEDIKFILSDLHDVREAHGMRITALENTNIERKGSKITYHTVIETVQIFLTLYLYYRMAFPH